MLTDEQCQKFLRIPRPINDVVREIFKAGFREGDASQDGAIGRAMKDLERAVIADGIGCVHVVARHDSAGHWLDYEFMPTRKVLKRLEELRNSAEGIE